MGIWKLDKLNKSSLLVMQIFNKQRVSKRATNNGKMKKVFQANKNGHSRVIYDLSMIQFASRIITIKYLII